MSTTYTLVYFAPSARGYDYTDGFIDSCSELSIEFFDSWRAAARAMAAYNAFRYNANLSKHGYSTIDLPEFEFNLLIDGKSIFGDQYAYDDECWDWDSLQDTDIAFNALYKEEYDRLVGEYKEAKNLRDSQKQALQLKEERAIKLAQYARLQAELGLDVK